MASICLLRLKTQGSALDDTLSSALDDTLSCALDDTLSCFLSFHDTFPLAAAEQGIGLPEASPYGALPYKQGAWYEWGKQRHNMLDALGGVCVLPLCV